MIKIIYIYMISLIFLPLMSFTLSFSPASSYLNPTGWALSGALVIFTLADLYAIRDYIILPDRWIVVLCLFFFGCMLPIVVGVYTLPLFLHNLTADEVVVWQERVVGIDYEYRGVGCSYQIELAETQFGINDLCSPRPFYRYVEQQLAQQEVVLELEGMQSRFGRNVLRFRPMGSTTWVDAVSQQTRPMRYVIGLFNLGLAIQVVRRPRIMKLRTTLV